VFFDNEINLREHKNRYHKDLKKCRFCSYQACLADLLEHLERDCVEDDVKVKNDGDSDEESETDSDDEESETDSDEESETDSDDEESETDSDEENESSYNFILIKCDVCDLINLLILLTFASDLTD
jgi:U3 small nucleolar RNA-associated protein 14